MFEFEYHQEVVPLPGVLPTCQAAGQDGWRLAAAIPTLVQAPAAQVIRDGRLCQVNGSGGQPQPGALLIFQRLKMPESDDGDQPDKLDQLLQRE